MLEAVLMNTAGGLTGGDRFDWQITVEEAACAVVTTPACERIYRTPADKARIETRLAVGSNAALAYLPQETIVYDRAALHRTIDADLAPNASLLLLESLIFGRAAMGEIVQSADILDSWRIRIDGRLLHAEQFRFQGDIAALFAKASVTGGAAAMATCLFVHDRAADIVDSIRDGIGSHGGASAWRVLGRDKMLMRMVARDSLTLRRALVPALLRCNKNLLGSHYSLPKVWSL
ncbi:MAG: urease accessory protein UreD [Pseudomonadota bacterium]